MYSGERREYGYRRRVGGTGSGWNRECGGVGLPVMRRLGIFLTSMLLLTPTSSVSQGWLPRAGTLPVTFQGPGDVLGTGWVLWFGLRAFSAATVGTKAANICNSGDATCADVNTLTNGNFDVTTATGAPLNCGGAGGTCTIKTLYDKSGTLSCTTACDLTQATIANRPTLVFNCINTTLPCIRWSGSGVGAALVSPGLAAIMNQPFSISFVFKNTAGALTDYITAGGHATIFMEHAANAPAIYAGSFGDFTAAGSVFHSVQVTYNNGTPANTANVDGTLSSPNPGGNSIAPTDQFSFGYNGNGGPVADTGELGWNSAAFSGSDQTNLCHNQRLYWGTGGSC